MSPSVRFPPLSKRQLWFVWLYPLGMLLILADVRLPRWAAPDVLALVYVGAAIPWHMIVCTGIGNKLCRKGYRQAMGDAALIQVDARRAGLLLDGFIQRFDAWMKHFEEERGS